MFICLSYNRVISSGVVTGKKQTEVDAHLYSIQNKNIIYAFRSYVAPTSTRLNINYDHHEYMNRTQHLVVEQNII